MYLYVAGCPEHLHHHEYTTVHPFCHILLAQGKVYEHQLSTDLKEKKLFISWLLFPRPVFNLEISQSGSYVPHVVLIWVILKMGVGKTMITSKLLSIQPAAPVFLFFFFQ